MAVITNQKTTFRPRVVQLSRHWNKTVISVLRCYEVDWRECLPVYAVCNCVVLEGYNKSVDNNFHVLSGGAGILESNLGLKLNLGYNAGGQIT